MVISIPPAPEIKTEDKLASSLFFLYKYNRYRYIYIKKTTVAGLVSDSVVVRHAFIWPVLDVIFFGLS
jgi:hypothetical protein